MFGDERRRREVREEVRRRGYGEDGGEDCGEAKENRCKEGTFWTADGGRSRGPARHWA